MTEFEFGKIVEHEPTGVLGCIVGVEGRRMEIHPEGYDPDTWRESIIVSVDDCRRVRTRMTVDGLEVIGDVGGLGGAITEESRKFR